MNRPVTSGKTAPNTRHTMLTNVIREAIAVEPVFVNKNKMTAIV
ncbi:hypothetical protein QNN00_03855 [Bacillus velezensis]|nr:hypothetical protein [Bacillus velezensis]